jgi:translocation and assembly module TamA
MQFSVKTILPFLLHIFSALCLALAAGSSFAATAPALPRDVSANATSDAAEADTSENQVRLMVNISGGDSMRKLLNDFLDINRKRESETMREREARRLIDITPRQIIELLATVGYFSPKVTPSIDARGDEIIARFTIETGPVTRIDTLDIRLTGAVALGSGKDANRITTIRRDWALRPGDVFTQEAWDSAKSAVLKSLLTEDFPAARIVNSLAKIEPLTHQAALSVEVDSGPAFTFGTLQLEGLERYPSSMIAPLNTIAPGDPYSQERLNDLQAKLQDSGYFRSVFATIAVDPARPDKVPVRVDLVENERKKLSLGVGLSTNTGPRAQIKYLDRRWLDRNWRLESELKVDRLTRLLGADVTFPARDNGWRPSVGAHYERSDIVNEKSDKINFGAHLGSPDRQDEQILGISYYGDKERIAETAVNNRQALIASWVYTRRRLDNLLAPQRGYQTTVELDGGLPGLVNRHTLVRATGHLTWLAEPGKRWQTIVRAQIGQVAGSRRQTVPGDLLFRTGGDQTIRGYSYQSLGVAQDGAIVGGRVFGLASGELVYKITPTWGAALFHDIGNAADTWRDWHPVHGTGVGGRWRSPIGPVNLDVAYGHEVGKLRLHFSVGYGF